MRPNIVPFRRQASTKNPNLPSTPPSTLRELFPAWWEIPVFAAVLVFMAGLFAWMWAEDRLWSGPSSVPELPPTPEPNEVLHIRTLRLVKGERPRMRRAVVEEGDPLPPAA